MSTSSAYSTVRAWTSEYSHPHPSKLTLGRLNHSPFKALQESFNTYATFFSRLFILILRSVHGHPSRYSLPLDPIQISHSSELWTILVDPSSTYRQFKPIFHALAYSLLHITTTGPALGSLQSPLQCFTILMCLRRDGSWDQRTSITPKLAMVQWGCRVAYSHS